MTEEQVVLEEEQMLKNTFLDENGEEILFTMSDLIERWRIIRNENQRALDEFKSNHYKKSIRCYDDSQQYDSKHPNSKNTKSKSRKKKNKNDQQTFKKIFQDYLKEYEQSVLTRKTQEKTEQKQLEPQSSSSKSKISQVQFNSDFEAVKQLLSMTEQGFNEIAQSGKVLSLNTKLENLVFVNDLCHEFCHAINGQLKPEKNTVLSILVGCQCYGCGNYIEEVGYFSDCQTEQGVLSDGQPCSLLRPQSHILIQQ